MADASIWNPGAGTVNIDAESTNASEVFTSAAAQTLYTLTTFTYTVGTSSLAIYRNGQRLVISVDWEETSSTSFTLLVTVAAGETIEAVSVIGSASESAAAAAASAAAAEAAAASTANWPLVDYVSFVQAPVTALAERHMSWNEEDGTLDLRLKGNNVTLQIGQEQLVRILNDTGAAFTDMQAVYITGAAGQRLTASLAQANAEATSSATIAIVTEPIANNAQGFATTSGLVRDVDTSAFAEGAALYLSPSVAGGITSTKPTAPNHSVLLGWCVRSHAVNGSIYVHVANGYELDELHGVLITSVAANQVLKRNVGNTLWENYSLFSGSDTWTGAPKTSVQTDNYLSFDISTKKDFLCTPTAGGTLTFTGLAAGQKGEIILVNPSAYTISKAASVKCASTMLPTISAAGTYLLAYRCFNGTDVYVTNSGALA